jgi:hypothetical protein
MLRRGTKKKKKKKKKTRGGALAGLGWLGHPMTKKKIMGFGHWGWFGHPKGQNPSKQI